MTEVEGGISFEELKSNAVAKWNASIMTQGTAYDSEVALVKYLTPENLPRISDEALARTINLYRPHRGGNAIEIVSIIAGEQERRSQAAMIRGQATADRALWWSRWGAWAAIVGALAAVVAAVAAVAVLSK